MSTHTIERRVRPTRFTEVRGSNGRQRWATAVTYGTVDTYGTQWLPRCFAQGLSERMPTILYGHDWYDISSVLGQGIDSKETPTGCDVLIEFADPKAVPNAALAMALTAPPNPVLRDCSVGFDRKEWLRRDELSPEQLAAGAEEAMVEAVMDELSLVVKGAVPGAGLRGVRSFVTKDERGRIMRVERDRAGGTGKGERASLKAALDAGRISRAAYALEVEMLDALDLADTRLRSMPLPHRHLQVAPERPKVAAVPDKPAEPYDATEAMRRAFFPGQSR